MAIEKVDIGVRRCPVMVTNSPEHDNIDKAMKDAYSEIQKGIKIIEYNEARSWEKARTKIRA